jgi:RNA polymerase sigma-70 factor (ECF subfamily)
MSEKDFEILFKGRFTPLCNLAYTLVKDADAAKDVVQQVFIKLWHKQNELSIHGPMEAYLYRMVINASLNYIEKEKKTIRLEDHVARISLLTVEPKENSGVTEKREAIVRNAIAGLPPRCQTVFSLSRFENLSNKEIADQLGISLKAVEKHVTIALKTLRTKLRPLIDSSLDLLFLFISINLIIQQVGFLILRLS